MESIKQSILQINKQVDITSDTEELKKITEYYKQLHANTVNNPEETDNFLQTYSPPKLNQEEII